MHEDNPFSYCDNYFYSPEAAMRLAPRPFFALSTLVFIVAAGVSAWKLLPVEKDGVMSCSTKAIMRFENMEKENVNGNIHFNFAANGKGRWSSRAIPTPRPAGSICSATSSLTGPANASHPPSATIASASGNPAPRPSMSRRTLSSTTLCEMSDSHDGLFLNAQKLNEKAILLSSINSPLYVCTLKSGSKLD
jgi:hypothetical protein